MILFPRRKQLDRYAQVVRILGKHGMGVGSGRIGVGRLIPFHRGWFGHAARSAPYTEPEHIRLAFEELGVTFIKLGQILSTRSDLVPQDYLVEFAKLRDRVPSVDIESIRAVVESELGAPLEDLFAEFDPQPLASASIGQVHAARLHDGTEVAVKVQKAGVAEQVETDLAVLRTLAGQLDRRSADLHRYGVVALVEEFGWTLRAELDYVREGRNAERFEEQFAEDPTVRAPRIYWDQTTAAVLTMERVSGIVVDNETALTDAGIDRRALARNSASVLLQSVFEHGFFHADPHPGNFLVQPDGSIVVLDFGMMGHVSEEMRASLIRLLAGVDRNDMPGITDALFDLGMHAPPDQQLALQRDLRHLLDAYYGLELGQVPVARMIDDISSIARRHALPFPADLSLLAKTVAMSEGVGSTLDPEFNLSELVAEIAGGMLRRTYSPRMLSARVARSSADLAWLALELPGHLRRVVRQMEHGNFEVRLRQDEIDSALEGFAAIMNRLAGSIVGAAIAIAVAIVLQIYQPPGWQIVAAVGLVLGPVAIGLLWSWAMLSSRRRG